MRRPKSGRRPLFLDPERYRRRRLMDAARMLPVLGAFLFILPVLWSPGTAGHNTAAEGVYLFGVWGMLILSARLFAPGLASGEAPAEDPPPTGLPTDPATGGPHPMDGKDAG